MDKEHFLDIWHGDILLDNQPDDYRVFLNDEEIERAGRFTRTELKNKYIKTRGILRKILAHYLNIEPQKIEIKIGEFGKPYVSNKSLFFNLSHTANQFVIAVSNVSELGVDMEICRVRKSMTGLVEKCFAEIERDYWHSLADEQKINMFFQFWVKKEAFVKAVGRGIALGLDQCVINPEQQTQFLSIPNEYGLVTDWKIVDISLAEDEACALVTKDKAFRYKQIKV
ncbi:MAG: 4'-phosphopantetheinyl transferase superfamily protein [Methylococcales bacterium]|nr:4'-phosphopantetheinyl transferase superfamily protein [Methylococcales bacterium]